MGSRKHVQQCVTICILGGLTIIDVDTHRKHLVVKCKESSVFFPHTPSDWRWALKAQSTVKRIAARFNDTPPGICPETNGLGMLSGLTIRQGSSKGGEHQIPLLPLIA